ncbi:MAG: hypothetical protein IKJ40_05140, partial [Bacteroidales bacterium]|nr:hypothetical protein [Bacteroidales bacterium]
RRLLPLAAAHALVGRRDARLQQNQDITSWYISRHTSWYTGASPAIRNISPTYFYIVQMLIFQSQKF